MPFDDTSQVHYAHCFLTTKSEDGDQRIIEGIASTPNPDRVNDEIDPMGAEYNLPMPLLFHHDRRQPVGKVISATRNKDGIKFKAQFANPTEPGTLKDRVDEAWQSVKEGLISAVSIGFRIKEYSVLDNGGWKVLKWDWYELSLVTIPANADCTIETIKSIDNKYRGASAKNDRVVYLNSTARVGALNLNTTGKGAPTMPTTAEAIEKYRSARAKKATEMDKIAQKAAEEGRTMEPAEIELFDRLDGEIKTIDENLSRLERIETISAGTKATQVVPTDNDRSNGRDADAKKDNGGRNVNYSFSNKVVGPDVPKGIPFARYVLCMAEARGNKHIAAELARKHYPDDARIANFAEMPSEVKAAVPAAYTGDSGGWAEDIAQANTIASEFIEFLRPMTIIDQVADRMRRVPFNVQVSRMTTGQNGYWTGEALPTPLTSGVFDTVTMGKTKVASISVLSKEQMRFSNISAETAIRDDLARAVAAKMDTTFVSTDAAVANVSPAGLLNGLTAISANGSGAAADVRSDLQDLFAPFSAANISRRNLILLTNEDLHIALMLLRTEGRREFPDVTGDGGTVEGFPIMSSNHVGAGDVIMLDPSSILLADDGDIDIDITDQASLEMLDGSLTQDGTAGTGASLVSLWQNGLVGIKAERFVNFVKGRAAAVAYIGAAGWNGAPTG